MFDVHGLFKAALLIGVSCSDSRQFEKWVLLTVWKLGCDAHCQCVCAEGLSISHLCLWAGLCILLSVESLTAMLDLQVNALQREMAAADTQHVGKKKKGFTAALR